MQLNITQSQDYKVNMDAGKPRTTSKGRKHAGKVEYTTEVGELHEVFGIYTYILHAYYLGPAKYLDLCTATMMDTWVMHLCHCSITEFLLQFCQLTFFTQHSFLVFQFEFIKRRQ